MPFATIAKGVLISTGGNALFCDIFLIHVSMLHIGGDHNELFRYMTCQDNTGYHNLASMYSHRDCDNNIVRHDSG